MSMLFELWKEVGMEFGLQPRETIRDKRLPFPSQIIKDAMEGREVLLLGMFEPDLQLFEEKIPPGVQSWHRLPGVV